MVPLAPLHNPACLEGMMIAHTLFPDVPHVAVFDTAFHQTMPPGGVHLRRTPEVARGAPDPPLRVPRHLTRLRQPGGRASTWAKPMDEVNLIVLHLGNGASATAVRGGRSVDTSMEFHPAGGAGHGNSLRRPRPCVPAHLHRELGWSIDAIDGALNRESA